MQWKLLTGAAVAAMLAGVAPAWADKGHGWKDHHFRPPPHVHRWHHPPMWGHYVYKPKRYVYREYHYYEPYAHAVPVPAPGVHIVLPSVYIPF